MPLLEPSDQDSVNHTDIVGNDRIWATVHSLNRRKNNCNVT